MSGSLEGSLSPNNGKQKPPGVVLATVKLLILLVKWQEQTSFLSSSLPTLGIQPLTSANYTTWKDQLDLTKGYFDLDYAIRNDEPDALTVTSTAEQRSAFEKWDKANSLSLMTVKNSIPLGLRGVIAESEKVKTYLKSVDDYFKGSSKALASSLMLKMLTLKYDGSSGVHEHIVKMSDMENKLKTLEMEVSDNFLVHFIMTSLPAQFDPFKIYYNAQKDKWKMSELIAMCQTRRGSP
uniref:uncharacterized protein LOC122610262 n=1 Tax=Erigeron canadensis TaxID=72917 RepID=UPI001CB928FE|nr:uncharacterized protein LOC122610262 [Erigeron canadensis]